jgi:hypothetical protein
MIYHVGQKVICVRDDKGRVFPNLNVLTRGTIYTIRGLVDNDGVLLEEVILPNYPYDPWKKHEVSFAIDRFRPVKTTDISIFTAMLAPSPVKETV